MTDKEYHASLWCILLLSSLFLFTISLCHYFDSAVPAIVATGLSSLFAGHYLIKLIKK